MTLPELSVVKALVPEQLCMVETLKPPVKTSRPFRVLVAELVWRIFPPEIVRPLVEASPPAPVESIPPAKVEVELFPRIVVVAVPPTPTEFVTASPKATEEVAVVEVAENVRKEGLTESTTLN